MKRCPECHRTYSDDTLSFCLEDGSPLSHDHISEETLVLPKERAGVSKRTLFTLALGSALLLGFVVFLLTKGYYSAGNPSPVQSTNVTQPAPVVSHSPLAAGNDRKQQSPTPSSTSSSSDQQIDSLKPDPRHPVIKNPVIKNLPPTLDADPALFPPKSTTPSPGPGTGAGFGPGGGGGGTDYSRIFRSSEVSSRARVLEKPEPSYTEKARNNQITGIVVLRAVFASDGHVTNISVIHGLPDGLTERAIAAAKKIRFIPAVKDGRPVSMWMQVEYNFNLY